MNINKNENSLKNNLYDANKITSKKIKLFNLKFIHRIFDSVNISLLILIFILSFISFNSQRKWTSIYKNLLKTRANNINSGSGTSKEKGWAFCSTQRAREAAFFA